MAIEIQHGPVSMYAQAAKMIGEAQAARQSQALALETQRQTADIQMMQHKEQLGMQAEQRAQEWEMQKMEMRSQSDFALEERRRQILAERDLQKQMREQDEIDAGIKIIQESNFIDSEQKPAEIYKFKMSKLGYNVSRTDEFTTALNNLTKDNNLTPEQSTTPEEAPEKAWYDPLGVISGTAKWRKANATPGMMGLGGAFGGGMDIPKAQPVLRLTDSDKEKLQALDETSRKSLETVLASGNQSLIQAALTRIRNL